MESGRLDLESATANAEVNGTKEPVATYKSIPDDDSNWQANNKPKDEKSTMGKQNDDVGVDDDAREKMLNDESNIVTVKEPTEVKFIAENGDAKIDIETVKNKLSGMGKEELMKYANDPFWIRLRWLLFVAFWLLWVGMLAGAIAIIVMAPKCALPPPRKWFEKSPILQLDAEDVAGRDENGVAKLLDDIKSQHIEIISLSNFLDVNGHTKDFRDVQPQVGTMENFDKIVKAAKERNQRVVLEIDPNHSSIDHPWFDLSVKRQEKYTDYYVWANPKYDGVSPNGTYPNNWLSINDDSAWEWNKVRGQYYLHQFNKTQPDFNFTNPNVIAEFSAIFSHWIDRGVSGFRLGTTQYLTEDPNLSDEGAGASGAKLGEYSSLNHVRTKDYSANQAVLKQWRKHVMDRTNQDGMFALRDDIGADVLAVYHDNNETLIDLPQSSQFLETANGNITAETLIQGVSNSIKNNNTNDWPGWDLNGNEASLRERMPSNISDSLTLMTLLLPGTPIVRLNDTRSTNETFAAIANARSGQTFLYGETEMSVINGTVFVYTRLKSGNPGYLVAYQSSDNATTIDVSSLKSIPSVLDIVAHSKNYVGDDGKIPSKLPSNAVPMYPKSTLVMTFVPAE